MDLIRDVFLRMVVVGLLVCGADLTLATTSGGGPMGTPVGGSAGTIPSGTGSDDSPQTTFSPGVRALDTVIAVACILLTCTTYAVLIGPGTRLLSTSKIPLIALEQNVGNLLARSWPDASDSAQVAHSSPDAVQKDAIRLLYAGHMDGKPSRAARGIHQCQAIVKKKVPTTPMWLTSGSSLTKNMVLLAVWEWVSVWSAIGMTVSTLAYNGFFSHQRGADALPRLVVVMMYDAGLCIHFWYTFRHLQSFLTLLAAGSSWGLLNKASFVSVSLGQLEERLAGGVASPVFKQLGKPAGSATFPVVPAVLAQDVDDIPSTDTEMLTDAQKSEATTVGDWQKRDITSCVEAGRSALDRIVANAMTMIGITVTTGFSVWTSQASSATAQLGSLALLASLTLGSAAMFSSAVDLSMVTSSFGNVLFLKEIMINGEQSGHVQKRASSKKILGFTHKSVSLRPVGVSDLASLSQVWSFVVFGPAYTLLPSVEDHERQSAGTSFEMRIPVRDSSVLFTTEGTSRHNTKADGTNSEAINVVYEPNIQQTLETNHRVKPSSYFWRQLSRKTSSQKIPVRVEEVEP